MTAALALALVLLSGPERAAAPRPRPVETARYLVEGPEPWKAVRPVEGAGYRVALSSPDGRSLVATVEVDGSPLRDAAPYPVDAGRCPPKRASSSPSRSRPTTSSKPLSRMLLRGATTRSSRRSSG